jgi:hypothetical protein
VKYAIPAHIRRKVASVLDAMPKERLARYGDYWCDLTPRNHQEYYDRLLFSIMSVHTSWQANVRGFLAVKALPEDYTELQLRDAIQAAKVGLTRMRLVAVLDLNARFWNDPERLYAQPNETKTAFRNRMVKETFGLALAKTSFAIELAYPADPGVVCLDTHHLQLYECPGGTPPLSMYQMIEDHWLNACIKRGVSSPMARHVFWDIKQQQPNTRYWSYVLERNTKRAVCAA